MPVSAVVSTRDFGQRFKFFSLLPALGVCWLQGFLEGQRPKHSKSFPREGAWLLKRGSLQGLRESGLQGFEPGGNVVGKAGGPHVALCIGKGSNKRHHSFIHSFIPPAELACPGPDPKPLRA